MTDYSARKLNSRIMKFIRIRFAMWNGRACCSHNFHRQKRAAVNVSTCRQIRRNTSSSRVVLTRISISSKFYFPSLLHFRRDTRELSHALVMQCRSTPLPEVIHAISKIVWEYESRGNTPLICRLEIAAFLRILFRTNSTLKQFFSVLFFQLKD